MIGYHFNTGTLRDGRPLPAIGEWLEHIGPIVPCESGLHMSEHPADALNYATDCRLDRVELEGDLVSHGDPPDKWVGRRRRRLATIDATALLGEYARWCASQVVDLWDAPQVVRDYLLTGDESLRADAAARSAAAAAAARSAADARSAAESAAWSAAWSAADAAAADARSAADAAAADAAQRAKLQSMVDAAFAQ
jgi:hypothetical protein